MADNAAASADAAAARPPFPLLDLPKELLVSVFEVADNLDSLPRGWWVRHVFPFVCKEHQRALPHQGREPAPREARGRL